MVKPKDIPIYGDENPKQEAPNVEAEPGVLLTTVKETRPAALSGQTRLINSG